MVQVSDTMTAYSVDIYSHELFSLFHHNVQVNFDNSVMMHGATEPLCEPNIIIMLHVLGVTSEQGEGLCSLKKIF